jgi:hypothetical protein
VVVSVYVLNIWQVAAKEFAAENPKAKLVVDLWPQLLIPHVLTARCLRFAILQHICRLLAMWPRHNTPPFVILFKNTCWAVALMHMRKDFKKYQHNARSHEILRQWCSMGNPATHCRDDETCEQ